MIKVAPSILSADFVNLERDIRSLPAAGADYVHVDVMDGMFVPNITIGIPVVAAISRIAPLPLDVHLMIERPIRYVDAFCKAGSSILTLMLRPTRRKTRSRPCAASGKTVCALPFPSSRTPLQRPCCRSCRCAISSL